MTTPLPSFRSARSFPLYGLWLLLLALLPLSGFAQTVTSDKDDYAPGEVATITGSGWTQDQQVHVEFKEEPDYPDYHIYDVAVNANGGWVVRYNIESRHIGVKFTVTAVGQTSGTKTYTVFTDANVTFAATGLPIGSTARITATYKVYKTIFVTVDALTPDDSDPSVTFNNPGPSSAIPVTTSQEISYKFSPVTINGVVYSAPAGSAVGANNGGGSQTITANYTANISATSLTAPAITGTYGGVVTLTATLKSGTTNLVGKTVNFSLNGIAKGSVKTDENGVATLANVNIAGINASTTSSSNYISATFAADASNSASNGYSILTVNKAPVTVANVVASNKVYDGNAAATLNTANAALSGVVTGENVTLTTSGATAAFANQNAGTRAVTVAGLALSGPTASNYTLAQPTGLTATITLATLTYTANAASRAYGAANPVFGGTVAGFIAGETQASATTGTLAFATTATTTSAVGSYAITGAGLTAANYGFTQAQPNANGLTIKQAQPVVSWTTPAAITYGTLLGAQQLNATASVPGTFAYSPASDTQLNAGANQALSVTFTPTDAVNYTTASKAVTLNVGKATPTIMWLAPAGITYGIALSGTQLNASTGGVAGAFAYTPAAGTVLNAGNDQTLSVSFAPADAANYDAPAAKTVALDVAKTNATVNVADYTGIYDGATHGATGTATGVAGVELTSLLKLGNTYTDAPGGTANWTFAGNTNYNSTSGTAQVVINPAGNAITFTKPADQVYAPDKTVALEASATSHLAVSFTVVSGLATISGNTLTITGAGTVTVTASQAGNGNYTTAQDVAQTFTVAKAPAKLALGNLTPTYTGAALAATATTTPAGLAGVRLTYAQGTTPVATPTDAGTYTVTATLDNSNYQATPEIGTLTIGKAEATVTLADLNQTYNGSAKAATATTTAAGTSSFTYAYMQGGNPVAQPTAAGLYQVTATLTNANYYGAATGTLVIGKANQTITVSAHAPASAMYGSDFTVVAASTSGLSVTYMGTGPLAAKGAGTFTLTSGTGMGIVAYAQAGDDNYNPAQAVTETVGATKLAAQVTVADYSGTYDGAAHGARGTATGLLGADLSAQLTLGASFTNAPGGTANWSFAGGDNYQDASGTALITLGKASAMLALGTSTFTYDGTAKPVAATTTPDNLTGVAITYQGTATAPTNAGSYALVATLTNGNYEAAPVSGALTIDKAAATVTLASLNATYIGNTHAATATTTATGASSFTLTYAGVAQAPTNAGQYAVVATLVNDNYSGSATGILAVAPQELTVTADDQTKTYGAANPALTVSYRGFVNSEGASALPTAPTATTTATATTGVGTYAVVASGGVANNYRFTYVPGTLRIDQAELTATLVASNKVYDGTTVATATGSVPAAAVLNNDALSVLVTNAAFASKQVGTGKTVTATVALSGAAAGNYSLTAPTATTTADITARPLTIALQAGNKAYDGNQTAAVRAALGTATPLISGDNVSVSASNGLFDTPNVGTGKLVNANVAASGADAANYAANTTATTTADITPVLLTPVIAASNKVYDGTTAATLSSQTVTGMVNGETAVGLTMTTVDFDTPNQGTSKMVTATGLRLTGMAAGNYRLAANATITALAGITPATLTYVATPTSRTYGAANGTLGGTVTGFVRSETIGAAATGTLTFASSATATSPVGAYPIGGSGLAATNGNYTFVQGQGNATALTITPATPTVVAVAATNLTYSGTAKAATTTASGVNGPADLLSPTPTLSYNGANGTTYGPTATAPTSVGDYTVTASFAGNHDYSAALSAPVAFSISPALLTVSTVAASKVYGEANPAFAVTYAGFVKNETPAALAGTLAFTTTATASSPVGSYAVTPVGLTAANYALTFTPADLTIGVRSLTVTATGVSRVYDGTTGTTVTLSDNHLGNDAVTLAYAAASFATKTVGTAKQVTVNGIAISGAVAGNYSLAATTTTTTADITMLPTTASFTAATKVYDGTLVATVTGRTVTAALAGDLVELGGVATFSNKNVGTAKIVSLKETALTGDDAGNYSLTTVATATANITARPLAVTATGVEKVYDGNTSATVTLSDDRVSGDVLTTSYTSATFDNANVDTGKLVAVSGIGLSGTDAGNYSANATTTTRANITVAATGVTLANSGPVQYSDQVTFTAALTSASAQAALNMTGGTVAFTLTSGSTSVLLGTSAYPADWRVANSVATVAKTFTISQPVGSYTVTAVFTPSASTNFTSASGTSSLLVNKENADVVYAGLEYFGTASPTSSTANVEYIATVTDRADGFRGTITNAQAAFKDALSTSTTPLFGTTYAVKLLSATDPTVGSARTGVQTVTLTNAEFSNGGKTFDLITEAQGNYYTGRTADRTLITVAVPGQDYVNGGGSVVIASQSAGSYAATAGSKMNFGFTMKWNKTGKNIQGQMNLIFRRLVAGVWRTYQVKSNAINTLGTGSTAAGNQGDFNTKANLTDITDPLNPLAIGGGLDLTVQALESTVTGAPHKIGVTLRDNTGTLLFSNNWVSGRTEMQALNGGKISVRSTTTVATLASPTTTVSSASASATSAQRTSALDLHNLLEVYPNPMAEQAVLHFHTAEGGKAQVYVYDQVGRLVTTLYNAEVQSGQEYYLPLKRDDYASGLYYCRLIANGQVENLRLTIVK